MLIYAVADIHGKSERFRIIEKNIEKHGPEALVVAGDLCAHFRPNPERDAEELSRLGLPVFLILGNSEPGRFAPLFSSRPNIEVLHLSEGRVGEASLLGVSGTFSVPFSSRLALRQGAIIDRLSRKLRPGHILVSHAPPYGACDKVMGRFSAGCKALGTLVRKQKPAAVLCGHIHESPGICTLGESLVVNCAMGKSQGALVSIEEGKASAEILS